MTAPLLRPERRKPMNPKPIDDTLKKMAKDIMDAVREYTSRLSYDKTYSGTVVSETADGYLIRLNGRSCLLKTKYRFDPGDTVTVIAANHNMNHLLVIPAAEHILRLVNGN